MKPIRLLLSDARRHRGLALIIVLSMLALATIVILAFLSVAETENKATNIYSASQASRRFADTAVNLVISQLREGAARETAGVPIIHATQPGAIRKYNAGGNFVAGYKLFSDQDMVFRSRGNSTAVADEERFVTESEPPEDWNAASQEGRYVDLNEPVVKGVADGAKNNRGAQVFFPVIDPRAGMNMDAAGGEVPIEGFSYDTRTTMTKANIGQPGIGSSTDSIRTPQGGTAADQLRLAMPVQWLYILRDGAVGYLDNQRIFRVLDQAVGFGEGASVTAVDAYGVPSMDNPMVGRVAFWADDESCKVNINTASEPTYAGQPIYYHERDHLWADCPPTRGEYQRFPGHPATVALSSVFFPNPLLDDRRSLDTYTLRGIAGGDDLNRAKGVKDLIYDLVPRIYNGGSVAGTIPFSQDSFKGGFGEEKISTLVEVQKAASERLYASVDELLFDQGGSNNKRVLNPTNGGGETLFNKTTLERASAFITAHSRSSELNLFGLPRVAMWPVATRSDKRTPFDSLIMFCSRLGADLGANSNLYVFQREKSRYSGGSTAQGHDISIARNAALLNMLDVILKHNFPESSKEKGKDGKSFQQKMGDDARQVLVSMFDYIRSTNVYDGFLAPTRDRLPSGNTGDWSAMYKTRDRVEADFKTYTVGPMVGNMSDPFSDRTMPGYGQVTPSIHPNWQTSGGKPIKGFGRFISVSEVGFHFICTADGQPDMYSWRNPVQEGTEPDKRLNYYIPALQAGELEAKSEGVAPVVSGGRTALMVNEDPLINGFQVLHNAPPAFRGQARLIKTREVFWRTTNDEQNTAEGQIKERYYSNFPPLSNPNAPGFYNTTALAGSQNPGHKDYGRFYRNHPGYDASNWNWTLPQDYPLPVNRKRIQALLHIEFFCPAVAYPEINPDFTIVVTKDSMSNIEINGNALFSGTGAVALRSERPLFSVDDHPETGGYASFRNASIGRRAAPKSPMPQDGSYNDSAGGQPHEGLLNLDLISSFFDVDRNQSLTFKPSSLQLKIYDHHVDAGTTEEPLQVININIAAGTAPAPDIVTAGSYAIDYIREDGVRIYHPALQAPRWWSFSYDGCVGRIPGDTGLPPSPSSMRGRLWRWDNFPGMNTGTRAVDPRKATGNNQSLPGAFALIYGKDGGNYADVEQQTRQTLEQVTSLADQQGARVGYGRSTNSRVQLRNADGDYNRPWHFGTDTVRSMVPASGDARMIAAKYEVGAGEWVPHRLWNDPDQYMAHNFSSYTAGTEPGFDRGKPLTNADTDSVDLSVRGLPRNVILDGSNPTGKGAGRTPDMPAMESAAVAMQRYGDFDDSDPGGRVGPFINKADEGNYSVGDFKFNSTGGGQITKKWRSTYFRSSTGARYVAGTTGFFTPNRMVSSPLMMGSLPSRIWQNDGAWTNLLFRPHVPYETSVTGGPARASVTSHPGQISPPDHYLADLFWMPVVEPYAISETFSTAGKINMNYQMLPFTHIRRATALHAAMKGELISAVPNAEYENSKNVATGWGTNASREPRFFSERDNRFWHRGIVVDSYGVDKTPWWGVDVGRRVQGTLRQFEERFTFGKGSTVSASDDTRGGLFRTTSQLCEMHLIPTLVTGRNSGANPSENAVKNPTDRASAMSRFWSEHAATGDNTRERPYSNLYAKLTTRSNTFRVHVRAQSIRKASRSVAANVFDPSKDQVGGEFRGSFLVERYLDQTDLSSIPREQIDYALAANPFSKKPLENYYRFRILESKRFAP